MKKKIALLLVVALTFMMVGCAGKDNTVAPDDTQTETPDDTTTDVTEPEDNTDDTADGNESQEGTTGAILLEEFKANAEANPAISAQDMADAILNNSIIQFSSATMEVQPGLLSGFSAEITGFDSAVMFAPMIGSIPFVGYIFTLADGSDVDAFVETLKTNADPRWNICVEADETVVDYAGNMVFFVMCPASLEE